MNDGLISDNINYIKSDTEGNLWIGTDLGISRLSIITSANMEQNHNYNSFNLQLDAYPNPFNAELTFRIYLTASNIVKISVFNVLGELVKQYPSFLFNPGNHELSWNSRNNHGMDVNSGIYYVVAESKDYTVTQKILLLK